MTRALFATGAICCLLSASAADARRRRAPRSRPPLRALVKASTTVALVRVTAPLSSAWLRVAGVRTRLARHRVRVVRKLYGRTTPTLLVVHGPLATWGRYSGRSLPSRGRVIAFLRYTSGRWHLTRRGAVEPASARSRVMHAIRIERIRAALARITARKAGLIGTLRGRAIGGLVRRMKGARHLRYTHHYAYRSQYLQLHDVEVAHRSGDKQATARVTEEVKRRVRRCSVRANKACVVKLKISVAPTYGAVVEHEQAKRDDCSLSSYTKRCFDKALSEIDAGNARATFGALLRFVKRK